MKITVPCMECFKDMGISSFDFNNLDITDDGLYELECKNGHKSTIILQNEKFEILFDMGVHALIEGYKQEAVLCMTVAFERFHEWCIKLFLKKKGVSMAEFDKTWKYVSNQSERQIGAFYFLYLNEFGETPEEFNTNKAGFRNKVVHKGYIPKYDEVFSYGEYVLNYIRKIIRKLENGYSKTMISLNDERQVELRAKCNNSINNMVLTTIIGLNYNEENHKNMSFEDALEFLKNKIKVGLS